MRSLIRLSKIAGVVVLSSLCLSACASLNIFSNSETTDAAVSVNSQQGEEVWRSGNQFIRIVDKGLGSSANDHPIALTAEEIKTLLGSLSLSEGFIIKSEEVPVFSAGEVQVLSTGLAKAFAEARPNDDIAFATVGPHPGTFEKEQKLSSARVFVRNGDFHIIFGLLHNDEVKAQTSYLDTGSRSVESDINSTLLLNPGQSFYRDPKTGDERDDWLVINMDSVLSGQNPVGTSRASIVSNELLQDVEQSKKGADNIKEDISKMKEVIFELTDEVQRLRRELDALKGSR